MGINGIIRKEAKTSKTIDEKEIVEDKEIYFSDIIDWLKSLRPQSQWKPSEEQMKALKEACDEHWEPDGLAPLYTLYQNLKELK